MIRGESNASHHVTIGNPAPVLLADGKLLLVYSRNNAEAFAIQAEDANLTRWGAPTALPVESGWTHLATGPPAGLLVTPKYLLVDLSSSRTTNLQRIDIN